MTVVPQNTNMLTWLNILQIIQKGNPEPERKVIKTEEDWKSLLPEDIFYVTRKKGTERPFSSEMCVSYDPGKYVCACCGTLLFDSSEKFDSGTGWPSFTQPVKEGVIAYHKDHTHGMYRIETICNTCDAHLGHVFQDGPPPSGLRFCINALALKKQVSDTEKAVFGGGCFWCTEAVFQQLKGVEKVVSVYSEGTIKDPTYKEVTSGLTGHAEVVEITYKPAEISFEDLVRIHFTTHDPTTLNRQGADVGTQYRSVIFYQNEDEKNIIEKAIQEIQPSFENQIVTEVSPKAFFYPGEDYHQDYFSREANKNPYCAVVIAPKLEKFRKLYKEKLKEGV